MKALVDTEKLPSLLVSHLTTSFPSLSTTGNHGSPLWFWRTSSLLGFRINDKREIRSPKARRARDGQLQPSPSPSLQEETLQPAVWVSLQPAETPASPAGAGCSAGSRHRSAQHRSSPGCYGHEKKWPPPPAPSCTPDVAMLSFTFTMGNPGPSNAGFPSLRFVGEN